MQSDIDKFTKKTISVYGDWRWGCSWFNKDLKMHCLVKLNYPAHYLIRRIKTSRTKHNALTIRLGAKVLREVSKEKNVAVIWLKLENLYFTKYLANRLYLKHKLYTFKMLEWHILENHLDDFNKIIIDLENIEIKIDDEDQTLLLLISLSSEFDTLSNTFIYGRDTLSLEKVQYALLSKELKIRYDKKRYQTSEGLYTRGIS